MFQIQRWNPHFEPSQEMLDVDKNFGKICWKSAGASSEHKEGGK